jgi:hypothetical protein
MTNGVDTLGKSNAGQPLSVTNIAASNADQLNNSKSITGRARTTQAEPGITNSTTSKPSASNATLTSTDSNSTTQFAPDAESIMWQEHPALTAQKNTDARGSYRPNGDSTPSESPDTFWQAAKEIVAQTFAVLRPGAVAAWITGDFVRNKQRVPFGEQWLALCVSAGFEPLAWATAWKQTDHGAQLDIFGAAVPQQTTRVSFFRRLANAKNPEAAILNEDVLFVRKPGWDGRGFDGSVSSPPYAEALSGKSNLENSDREHRIAMGRNPDSAGSGYPRVYGTTPGQLGALPAGDAP